MRRRKRTQYAPLTIPWALSPVSCCFMSISALFMDQSSTSGTGEFLVFRMGCSRANLLFAVLTAEHSSLPDVTIQCSDRITTLGSVF